MKRTLFLAPFSLPLLLSAQPVINYSDFPYTVGTSTAIQMVDYVTAGPATANFDFDASGVPETTPTQSQVLLPASTPYASYFPSADYATAGLINPQQFGYFDVSPTATINLGLYGPTASLIYSNGEKLMQYPLSMGNTWSDAWSADGNSGGQAYTRAGTTTGVYNGYGTVHLPFGTFANCARLQIDQVYSDEFPGQTITYEVRIVSYLKPGVNASLFSSTYLLYDFGFGMDTMATYSTMVDPSGVGLEEIGSSASDVLLFPNPAADHVTLLFGDMPAGDRVITIIDAAGRAVKTANGIPSALVELPVADLHRGMYIVRIQDGDGRLRSLPLVLN